MVSNPQSALPWVQTLAGLFGGLVSAKAQERANPRQGFSMLPIFSGGLNGLATGLSGQATRAELLRQEQRASQGALGDYAAMSGLPISDVQAKFGGVAPTEYRSDVGTAIREREGNTALGRQFNIANPGGLGAVDQGILGGLFGELQKQMSDRATTDALPTAQGGGLYDAGGNRTSNAMGFPVAPSLSSLLMPQHRALLNALNGPQSDKPMSIPGIRFMQPGQPPAQSSTYANGTGGLAPITLPDGSTRVYSRQADGTITNVDTPANAVQAGVSRSAPGVPVTEDGGVDMGYPKTFAQYAMMAKQPTPIVNQYTASANAANMRNTRIADMYNTAQTVKGANERSILDYEKPTEAGIIANGTQAQKDELIRVKEAGYRRQQSLLGIEKPATRGEISASVKQIQNNPTRAGRIAAARLATQTGALAPEQAVEAANGSVFGTSDPITVEDLGSVQATPPASTPSGPGPTGTVAPGNGPSVAPRAYSLNDFLPAIGAPPYYVPMASKGAVGKRARENNGSPRKRWY